MNLTTYRRARIVVGAADNNENKRLLSGAISGVSSVIEEWIHRLVELTSRTEDYNIEEGQRTLFTKAFPITAITSIKTSPTGVFGGEETTLTANVDYIIGAGGRSVQFLSSLTSGRKALRAVLTSGLATTTANTTLVLGSLGATAFTAGRFVLGSVSGAHAYIVSHVVGTGVTVLEMISGVFQVGDVLSEYTAELLTGTATASCTGTVTSITTQSLVDLYPALASACENEVAYFYSAKNSPLHISGTSESGTQKRELEAVQYRRMPLQYETRQFLIGLERILP